MGECRAATKSALWYDWIGLFFMASVLFGYFPFVTPETPSDAKPTILPLEMPPVIIYETRSTSALRASIRFKCDMFSLQEGIKERRN